VAIGIALAVALVTPLLAQAKRVTIGSDLPEPNMYGYVCDSADSSCLAMQTHFGDPTAPPLRSPFGGNLTRFRYRHAQDTQPYHVRVQVMHGVGDGEYRATGQSRRLLIPKAAGIYRFRVHLPIRKRDRIAVLPHGSLDGARKVSWIPAPPLFTVTSPTHASSGVEYLWNATVRMSSR
jgi:hypothetical protein